MKKIIFAGMIILLAGCSHVISGELAADLPEGWFSPDKSELQLSQDLSHCKTRCESA